MNFEANKVAGAVLGTLLFTMGLGIVSEEIYAPAAIAKAGYDLPAAVEAGGEHPTAAAPAEPLPVLLAKADPKKGEMAAKPCTACHNFEKGGAAKVGPPLWGIVDRPKGSVAGFAYSDGLKQKGGNWTFDDLDKFLQNPKAFVSGTKMAFAGEKDPAKEADIIIFLRTLSDNPAPLPKVEAAAAAPQQKPESPPAPGK
jgi:cytochrome c